MPLDLDQPLVCVGGPDHGRMVAHNGHFMEMPNRTEYGVPGSLTGQEPRGPLLDRQQYERKEMKLVYGSLEISGWCWLWRPLCNRRSFQKRDVLRTMVGMILAAQMKEEPCGPTS